MFFIMFIALSGDSKSYCSLGKKMAAKVIAVSKDNWVKTDFGADYIIDDYNRIVDRVEEITEGKMADVVLNSSNI
jgi:NADPH:quinone reductase-like Zn-dependent oxidoreductase